MSGPGLAYLGLAHRAEHGIALIVTLFVVALLTILVLEYHFDAVIEIDMAANYADDVRAHHLALAGVQFAQALLQLDDTPKSDGPEDTWYTIGLAPICTPPQQLLESVAASVAASEQIKLSPPDFASEKPDNQSAQETQSNEGCVSLRIIDESGKLPINALAQASSPLPPPQGRPNPPNPPRPPNTATTDAWKNIFTKFFESFDIKVEVVGALIDWIDNNETEEDGGAEESYYAGLATPYTIRDGPMRMPGELRLIKGFDIDALSKLFPGITPQAIADVDLGSNPYLTPYGETSGGTPPKVNFNTADSVVLHALIDGLGGGSSCDVEGILLQRQQKQFQVVSEITAICNAQRLTQFADVKSTAFRIEALGQVGAIQKKAVAVVERGTQANTQPKMVYFKIE